MQGSQGSRNGMKQDRFIEWCGVHVERLWWGWSVYGIVSLVRHPSIWKNSVVLWVLPLVGRVYAPPHVVISMFCGSDFKDLATGLSLSLGPMRGTCFRPKLDKWVDIYCSSRVNWKLFCSSRPEPISNEWPYKYSILQLLSNVVVKDSKIPGNWNKNLYVFNCTQPKRGYRVESARKILWCYR